MSKDKSKALPSQSNRDQDQWMMLLPDCCTEEIEEKSPAFCKLCHPKTGQAAQFLFSADSQKVHEVLRFNDKYRSWFIGDKVQSDGSIILGTTVDPIFLVLPYLIKAAKSGKFMQLEQIVDDSDYPECNRLSSCLGLSQLPQVSEVKGADDYKVYRYDVDKTLKWLKAKVTKLVTVLKEKKIQANAMISYSSTYIAANKASESSHEDYERFAHGVISEYLPVELSQQLKAYLDIKDIVHEKPDIQAPNAKRKKSDIVPTEDYSQQITKDDKPKNTRLTLKQKQLEKVDKSGMKNIASFFSPKSKK